MVNETKKALIECGKQIVLKGGKENCTEILYLAREEILQEIALGIIEVLDVNSDEIYEFFLRSDNDIIKIAAIRKIYNDVFFENIILNRAVYYSDYVKMKAIEQIKESKVLTGLLKNQSVYERSCFLVKIAEKLNNDELFDIIISDEYNIDAKMFFVSKITDRRYLEKLITESSNRDIISEAQFCLRSLN